MSDIVEEFKNEMRQMPLKEQGQLILAAAEVFLDSTARYTGAPGEMLKVESPTLTVAMARFQCKPMLATAYAALKQHITGIAGQQEPPPGDAG